MHDLVIRDALIVTPERRVAGGLAVRDGRIAATCPAPRPGTGGGWRVAMRPQ